MDAVAISLAQPDAWRDALKDVPHAFGHTWDSCLAMSLTSGARPELFHHEDQGGRAVCPVQARSFRGHLDLVTPYGFGGFAVAGRPLGLERVFRAFAERRGFVAGYIGLHPTFSPDDVFSDDRVVGRSVFTLDLASPEEELFAGLRENRRRELRRWRREPPRTEWSSAEVGAFVRRHFRDCHRTRGASATYMFSDETLDALMDSPAVFTLAAGRGDGLEAACMFGHTPYEGQYLFNVSTDAGRSLTTGLIWEGQRRLRAMGVPTLNLGGGVGPGDDDGVARYKARFGAEARPLVSLQQVYRPDVYEALCREAGVRPEASGYFPAYRA